MIYPIKEDVVSKLQRKMAGKLQRTRLKSYLRDMGIDQQVEPLHDYYIEIFDKFINSLNIKNEKHKLLVKIWIISLLIPDISHPMFLPYGEKGSAKSTLQRKIKILIDPSNLDLLSIYNEKTNLFNNFHTIILCFYDNVRHEPSWLSDEAM